NTEDELAAGHLAQRARAHREAHRCAHGDRRDADARADAALDHVPRRVPSQRTRLEGVFARALRRPDLLVTQLRRFSRKLRLLFVVQTHRRVEADSDFHYRLPAIYGAPRSTPVVRTIAHTGDSLVLRLKAT